MKLLNEEQHNFLLEHYKGVGNKALTDMLNERFGLALIPEQIKKYKYRHSLDSGLDGRFQKGAEGYWTGKKRSPETVRKMYESMAKKGLFNGRCLPLGSESQDFDGYVMVKIAQPNVWKQKHLVLWETEHGPIPEGMKVIFLNRDKNDIRLENLALCDQGTNAYMALNGIVPTNEDIITVVSDVLKVMRKTKEVRKLAIETVPKRVGRKNKKITFEG